MVMVFAVSSPGGPRQVDHRSIGDSSIVEAYCFHPMKKLASIRRPPHRPAAPHPHPPEIRPMSSTIARRTLLRAGASGLALSAAPSLFAQGTMKMRLSTAFTEQDMRADAYKAFGAAMKSDFQLEPYWGNTLFKQGTELVALQRGNLEMANLAPQEIAKQLPAWSLLTSAYLFRDVA